MWIKETVLLSQTEIKPEEEQEELEGDEEDEESDQSDGVSYLSS